MWDLRIIKKTIKNHMIMKLKHLLLLVVATAAVLPATADVHPRYTTMVSDATTTYVTKRPPAEERLFTSAIIEKRINCLYGRYPRDVAARQRCPGVALRQVCP